MGTANRLLDVARSQIGYVRADDPERGSKYGRWYSALTGEDYYTDAAYCAMFVSWCCDQAGVDAPGIPGAYCPWILSAGRNEGRLVYNEDAQPGDLVLFDWGGDGVADHIGLVESNNGSYLTTIEGNTSSGTSGSQSNGGGVWRRTRNYSTVIGISRPYFTQEEEDEVTNDDIQRIAAACAQYTYGGDSETNRNMYNTLHWLYSGIMDGHDSAAGDGTTGNVPTRIDWIDQRVREMSTTVAAQAAAIEALAKAQGANPDQIAKAVSDAVAAKLATIKLDVTTE